MAVEERPLIAEQAYFQLRDRIADVVPLLRDAAREVSHRLGWGER